MKKKVEILLRLFEEKSLKKDSHNSHNPPSQDKGRAKLNQSRHRKSTKKSGGQSGHKGHTFQIRKNPTEVILLQNDYCSKCGEDLDGLDQMLISKHQVLEFPTIELGYIEYQQMPCSCPRCFRLQKAQYLQNVTAPIQCFFVFS